MRASRRADEDDFVSRQRAYEQASLVRDVTSSIKLYLDEHNISRTELAARLHVTPGRVSQILSGDANLTLGTLATVAAALGAHFTVGMQPHSEAWLAERAPAEPLVEHRVGRWRSA
jgi:transcriptional regulator with XRE-family HTH domain